jgi:hypothetical protein
MHEYERQWSRGGSHAVRHPLRLKMERLAGWCEQQGSVEEFEQQLEQASHSEDDADALLADELLPLWRETRSTGRLPFVGT